MDRPPSALPLPRPKPGEAIIATALAGALGLATWACVPFVAFVPAFVPVVALMVVPLAFHWLRFGLVTAKNSPERGFTLPSSSTAVRIGGGAFAYAPLAAGTICAVVGAILHGGGDLAYEALVLFSSARPPASSSGGRQPLSRSSPTACRFDGTPRRWMPPTPTSSIGPLSAPTAGWRSAPHSLWWLAASGSCAPPSAMTLRRARLRRSCSSPPRRSLSR